MKRVLVGISGGVDSSVAAVFLQNQGYEVVGVTFVFTEDFDANDAVKVCEKLKIEHHIIDYRKIFKETIIDKFIEDYNEGITPNPCILCNRLIKFNYLYENMKKLNCDYFATGHYAKIINGRLYKSENLNKDQTYFLCNITKEQLNSVMFPLEGISKEEVRKLALEKDLVTADKKDSTDVCFINDNFKDYIKDKINNSKGKVIDINTKEVIGYHEGLNRYTIGQRRGLNIGGSQKRMYVADKDIKNNILYIATGDDNNYLLSNSCILKDVNLFNNEKIKECKAKFRHRQEEVDVKLNWLDNNEVEVIYDNVKTVTPGQACAFYNGDECLGGGIIKSVNKE